MSHDRGCSCGREKYEYSDCDRSDCHHKYKPAPKVSQFDFEPDLGASTPEPSIREIIYRYYRPYFDENTSKKYTDQYLKKIQEYSTK